MRLEVRLWTVNGLIRELLQQRWTMISWNSAKLAQWWTFPDEERFMPAWKAFDKTLGQFTAARCLAHTKRPRLTIIYWGVKLLQTIPWAIGPGHVVWLSPEGICLTSNSKFIKQQSQETCSTCTLFHTYTGNVLYHHAQPHICCHFCEDNCCSVVCDGN